MDKGGGVGSVSPAPYKTEIDMEGHNGRRAHRIPRILAEWPRGARALPPAGGGRTGRGGPDRPRRALFLFRFPGLGGGRAGGLKSGGGRWV